MPSNTPDNAQKNPDIDMSDEYASLIPGLKQFPYKVHGFNIDNALLGLNPKLAEMVKKSPCVQQNLFLAICSNIA
jgi:hypothetical protein